MHLSPRELPWAWKLLMFSVFICFYWTILKPQPYVYVSRAGGDVTDEENQHHTGKVTKQSIPVMSGHNPCTQCFEQLSVAQPCLLSQGAASVSFAIICLRNNSVLYCSAGIKRKGRVKEMWNEFVNWICYMASRMEEYLLCNDDEDAGLFRIVEQLAIDIVFSALDLFFCTIIFKSASKVGTKVLWR